MNSAKTSLLLLLLFILVNCGAQFGPGYSMHDKHYFRESPHIAMRGTAYSLRWQYGSMGFYFEPGSKIVHSQLLFSLQGTSSSSDLRSKYGEVPITDPDEIKLLQKGEVYWLEPDGQKVRLELKNLYFMPVTSSQSLRTQLNGRAIRAGSEGLSAAAPLDGITPIRHHRVMPAGRTLTDGPSSFHDELTICERGVYWIQNQGNALRDDFLSYSIVQWKLFTLKRRFRVTLRRIEANRNHFHLINRSPKTGGLTNAIDSASILRLPFALKFQERI
ncbi:hypothetical protein BH11VER1_BH11VER1_11490 [soil metagenome]